MATTPKPSDPAGQTEYRDIGSLLPYARNARTHTDEQVRQLAASITEWGWTMPVLIDEPGMILAGHARVRAAALLALKQVPVVVAKGWSEPKKRAYILADNKLALNAGWDDELLKIELQELSVKGFEMDILAFDQSELDDLLGVTLVDEGNTYTQKVDIPTYKPTGEKPSLEELYDDEKAMDLITSIQKSKLNEKEKQFLMAAASRHIVFNYGKIANFYAHSSKECQELMEDNALVIIDFNKAIENGLVRLTENINNMFNVEEDEDVEDDE